MPRAPKQDPRVQLQFRLDRTLRDRMRAEAKRRQVSVNWLTENILEAGVTKMEREKTPKPHG